jgi:hypothetical protein
MHELKQKYTLAIVTHNLQQATRVADKTAFMYVDISRPHPSHSSDCARFTICLPGLLSSVTPSWHNHHQRR